MTAKDPRLSVRVDGIRRFSTTNIHMCVPGTGEPLGGPYRKVRGNGSELVGVWICTDDTIVEQNDVLRDAVRPRDRIISNNRLIPQSEWGALWTWTNDPQLLAHMRKMRVEIPNRTKAPRLTIGDTITVYLNRTVFARAETKVVGLASCTSGKQIPVFLLHGWGEHKPALMAYRAAWSHIREGIWGWEWTHEGSFDFESIASQDELTFALDGMAENARRDRARLGDGEISYEFIPCSYNGVLLEAEQINTTRIRLAEARGPAQGAVAAETRS